MTNTQHTTPRTVKNETADGTPAVTRTVHADTVVSREVDDEEREVLRVPISSTRPDREGDAFSESDLRDRASQIKDEQPLVFDDHGGGGLFSPGYSARETIGTQFDAEVEEGDDGQHTLYAYVNPDHSHEEGSRMLSQVRDEKQAIKFSVGFRILETADDLREEDRPERANEVAGRLFTRTDLMETSRVGIPANPDASAGVAAKNNGGRAGGGAGRPVVVADRRTLLDALGASGDGDGAGFAAKSGAGAKGACESDEDCPEGEVCRDGECVPEDGDGDDEESSASAELAALREEVRELRQELKEDDEDDDDDDDDEGDEDGDDDDDDEEESSGLPEGLKYIVEGNASEEDLKEIESKIREYRGADTASPDTADTSTGTSDLPTTGRSEDTDGEDDGTDSTQTNDGKTAYELSRGN